MKTRIYQLGQLTRLTHDGDLVSSSVRDEFVKAGLVARGHGWNWLTDKGAEYAINLGLACRACEELAPMSSQT